MVLGCVHGGEALSPRLTTVVRPHEREGDVDDSEAARCAERLPEGSKVASCRVRARERGRGRTDTVHHTALDKPPEPIRVEPKLVPFAIREQNERSEPLAGRVSRVAKITERRLPYRRAFGRVLDALAARRNAVESRELEDDVQCVGPARPQRK